MPPTEQCALGAANKAKIEGLEKMFVDFRDDMRDKTDDIAACVKNLTNHYSKRFSHGTVIALVALTNLLTGLVLYIITCL